MRESHRKIIKVELADKVEGYYGVFLNYKSVPIPIHKDNMSILIHGNKGHKITAKDLSDCKGKVFTTAEHQFKNCILFVELLNYAVTYTIPRELL